MGTIAAEISALRQRISQAYDVIDQKGGDVPLKRTSWNLSASIESIRVGEEGIVPIRYLESPGGTSTGPMIETEFGITNQPNSKPMLMFEDQFIYDEDLQNTDTAYSTWGVLDQAASGWDSVWQHQLDTAKDTMYLQIYKASQYGAWKNIEHTRHSYSLIGYSTRWFMDTTTGTTGNTNTDYSPPPCLFGVNFKRADGSIYYGAARGKSRIFSWKHWQQNKLMQDLTPVRIGSTGYMLNLATGRLLGNVIEGAPDFILGPDVDFKIPGAQRVDYLQFSGTQWFDTLIQGDKNTYIEVETSMAEPPTTAQLVVGWRESATSRNISILYTNNGSILMDFGNYNSTRLQSNPTSTAAITTRYVLKNAYGSRSIQAYYQSGGLWTATTTYNTDFTTENLLVGHAVEGYVGGNIGDFTGRLHHLQIENRGVIQRDLWPCRKNGVGMLYDLVTGTFFENQGTGDFILGPDV